MNKIIWRGVERLYSVYYNIEIHKQNPGLINYKVPEWTQNRRGLTIVGFDYTHPTDELVCCCKSDRGRLMKKKRYGIYYTEFTCDHTNYGNQTGCGLTVRFDSPRKIKEE